MRAMDSGATGTVGTRHPVEDITDTALEDLRKVLIEPSDGIRRAGRRRRMLEAHFA
jgi:hypothetical protein